MKSKSPEVLRAANEQVDTLRETKSSLSALADRVAPPDVAPPTVEEATLVGATGALYRDGRTPEEVAAYTLEHRPTVQAA